MSRQQRIEDDLSDLLKAIQDEGSHPIAHREIMSRHRREWPTLWRLIDDILHAKNMTKPPENLANPGVELTKDVVNGKFHINWHTPNNEQPTHSVSILPEFLKELVEAINRAKGFQ